MNAWLFVLMGSKRGVIAAYAVLALAALLLATLIALSVSRMQLAAQVAQVDAKDQAIDTLQERLDNQGTRISELVLNAKASQTAFDNLRKIYQDEIDAKVARLAADEEAIAAAVYAQRSAEATARLWMNRYADQIRQPACEQALNQLEAACPALQGY